MQKVARIDAPPRLASAQEQISRVPVHAVWELTLACDLKCLHCGSRAGARRPHELNTAECYEVVDALAALGTREISLIGGEAYLRSDLACIIRRIRSHGIYCAIQTGGRNFTPRRLGEAVEAGLGGLGVSLDGLEPLHDELRGVHGSFRSAVDTLQLAHDAGLRTSVNTQIGARTMSDLAPLLEVVAEVGAKQWQVQLSTPIGNAVDHDDLLLQPYRLAEVMPVLAELYHKGLARDVLLMAGNNIGYFGPYEHLWRGFGDETEHWTGCSAGSLVVAIESDGTVKGCPSLPTRDYAGGNVRQISLEDIWRHSERVDFARGSRHDMLWGFCRSCYYAEVCGGGCTWMSHALLGRPGNNPYCHHRVLQLRERGMRERIRKTREAAAEPFAVGEFELVLETVDGHEIERNSTSAAHTLVQIVQAQSASPLTPCRNCDAYVMQDEAICPHCGADLALAARTYKEDRRRSVEAWETVERLLQSRGTTFASDAAGK
ncbi:MAG: GDL motif peptide-associated radical SAM/SPASM maturase [Acidobacteriaceae bacterium]